MRASIEAKEREYNLADEDELQRRLQILKAKLEEGKIAIAEHLRQDMEESLSKVRYGSDGRVDLSSVDGRIRSMAMAVAMMKDRDDTKSAASLSEIQAAFFERITSMFEGVHKLMLERNANPQSFSLMLSSITEQVEANYPLINPFVNELYDFWKVLADPVRYHLEDMKALKGVFGGDLFPSYDRNIASTSGLYLDTIILSDPFMNTKELFSRWPKDRAVQMFLKHGLQLMNYRSLALAEFANPIVAILPSESAMNSSYKESLFSASGRKALEHAGRIFGRVFESIDDLKEFLTDLETPDKIVNKVANPSRLLFDTDWTGDHKSQIKRAIDEFSELTGEHAGEIIFSHCYGRMSQATDVAWKSMRLGGVPLIDAPTSWQYYNWSLEYDAGRDPSSDLPLHMSRGLDRLAASEMKWLGNIPPDALIQIRKEGALPEIRQMLSAGVEDVIALDPSNFFRSADKIYANFEESFREHQRKIDELSAKKWKFAGSDIGSWVVVGSIEVAAAIFATPALGLASFVASQISDAPKLRDIPAKFNELRKESKELSKSAAGLLFRHQS